MSTDVSISYLVKTKTYSVDYALGAENTETYLYDSLNRIIKVTNSISQAYDTFIYTNDTLFISKFSSDTAGQSISLNKIQLNNRKLAVERLQPYPNRIIDISEQWKYDNNDFLKYYSYSVTDYITDDTITNDGKNITQKKGFSSGLAGTIYFTTTYAYYTNANTIDNNNFGKYYLGKDSKDLIRSKTTKSVNTFINPTIYNTSTTYYTYEFDNFGRVITQYAKTDNFPSKKTTFTY